MATIYTATGPVPDASPIVGAKYWWFADPRAVLTLTVLRVGGDGTVRLRWQVYACARARGDEAGEVTWTRAEWAAAHLRAYREPIEEADLGPGEALCRLCWGTYFAMERDLEITGCLYCMGTGKMEERPEPPGPTRRSGLHPELPPAGREGRS
jgi:hypothetical protein